MRRHSVLSLFLAVATALPCNYNILLLDLFGDGWANIDILITTNTSTFNRTMLCASCYEIVNVTSTNCDMNVSMTSKGTPIAPWEVMWMVVVGNQTLVGGFDSTLRVNNDTVSGNNMLDYNPTSSEHVCSECTHPPKPRHSHTQNAKNTRTIGGTTKPKPSPVPVPIDLMDNHGSGKITSFLLSVISHLHH